MVHGLAIRAFSTSTLLILAWGGRSLCVLKFYQHSNQGGSVRHGISNLGCVSTFDWILDASFRPNIKSDAGWSEDPADGRFIAAIVTAHDSLVKVQVDHTVLSSTPLYRCRNSGHTEAISLRQLTVGLRTICYSAHLKWLSESRVLVAAGTAFGDISIRTYDLANGEMQTSATFPGHEGSIFGVRISDPLLTLSDQPPMRLLSTCSDDRTIRVWDITSIISDTSHIPLKIDAGKEKITGFIPFSNDGNASTLGLKCVATTMAHISRIWSVHFLANTSDEASTRSVELASIGEDATCLTWELVSLLSSDPSASTAIPWTLQTLGMAVSHSGKNIWSLATAQQPKLLFEGPIILTGGSDAAIQLHTLRRSRHSNSRSQSLQWFVALESASVVLPSPTPKETLQTVSAPPEDLIRAYAFLEDGDFLFTTNRGRLFVSALNGSPMTLQRSPVFIQAATFGDLAGYSVAIGLPSQNVAFFAGGYGVVRCYDATTRRIFEVSLGLNRSRQKITNLFAQDIKANSDSKSLITLVVAFVQSVAPQIVLLQREENGDWKVSAPQICAIPTTYLGKEITASLTALEKGRLVQWLGLRNGCIIGACFGNPSSIDNLSPFECATESICTILDHVHARDAVTGLHWRPKVAGDGGWLYSVGRDGNLTVHHLGGLFSNASGCRLDPLQVHQLPVHLGKDLEGLHVGEKTRELSVFGFHSTNFVLYDVLNSHEILSIQCGGAHRTWKFDIHRSPETGRATGGSLLWTKASKSNLCSVTEPSTHSIRPGLHGREIKACAIAPKTLNRSSLGPLVATGAEDTDIRLITYMEGKGHAKFDAEFRCVAIIRKHDTGIQSLKWSESGSYLFSSGGFEEFYIWKISTVPILGVGVVCESCLPVPVKRSEQRISDFAIKEIRKGNGTEVEFQITMVYSNSFIKTYRYEHIKGGSWTLLYETQYTTSSLTALESVCIDDTSFILTGATDGHLAIWQEPAQNTDPESAKSDHYPSLALSRYVSLHRNSIKTISIWSLSADATLVLTGGDDNAVGISLLRCGNNESGLSTNSILIPRAHAASITSSTLFTRNVGVEDPHKLKLRAMTSGNDQRMKLWGIDIDLAELGVGGIHVKRIANQRSAVADVSSMAVFPDSVHKPKATDEERILICGVGLEVWKLTL